VQVLMATAKTYTEIVNEDLDGIKARVDSIEDSLKASDSDESQEKTDNKEEL